MAIRAWNYLSNGHGGLDWSGLPIVAAHLGVADLDGLMHRLLVIKTHRPDKPAQPSQDE